MTWLHEIPLGPKADAFRRTLDPASFRNVERSIEHLALIGTKPVAQIAEGIIEMFLDIEGGCLADVAEDDLLKAVITRLFEAGGVEGVE